MASNLKNLRTLRGFTQQHVYEAAGISKSYYSELENGKKQLNERLIGQLAKVLSVEPYMLVINSENQSDIQFVSDLADLNSSQRQVLREMAASLAAANRQAS